MTSGRRRPYDVGVSFSDVFKSSKVLRQEMAALVYKKKLIEEENKRYSALEALVPQDLPATTPPQEATAQPPPAAEDKAPAPEPSKEPAKEPEPAKKDDNVSEWTAEQDAELLKLKSENATWRSIGTTIGKPVGELKQRWGLIRPAVTPKPPKEVSSHKIEEEKQPEAQEGNKPRIKRRVSFTEPLFGAGKAEGSPSTRKVTYYPGDKFTLEEIIMLNKLAEKYEEEKWLRISSRFYDKTGSRISPEEAKQYVLTNSD